MRTSRPHRARRLARATTVVVVLVVLLAAACGDEAATVAGDGGIEHPTGEDELVLRIASEGGFLPVGQVFATVPALSVYGGGRVITTGPQIEIFPPPALPNLLEQQATDEGLRALLAAAEEAGLLEEPPDYGQPPIADAPTTVVTIHAEGRTFVHAAVALGEAEGRSLPGLSDEHVAARGRLAGFVRSALGPEGLPPEELGPEERYVAPAFAVWASPAPPADPADAPADDPAEGDEDGEGGAPDDGIEPEVRPWPLPDVDLAAAADCLVVDGAATDALRDALATANQLTRFEQAGAVYELAARPLLPDDEGCPAS